jgi:DNA mismatch repair protein MutS
MNEKLLDLNSNNFLAGIHIIDEQHFGLAFLDISTGEFLSPKVIANMLISFYRDSNLLK